MLCWRHHKARVRVNQCRTSLSYFNENMFSFKNQVFMWVEQRIHACTCKSKSTFRLNDINLSLWPPLALHLSVDSVWWGSSLLNSTDVAPPTPKEYHRDLTVPRRYKKTHLFKGMSSVIGCGASCRAEASELRLRDDEEAAACACPWWLRAACKRAWARVWERVWEVLWRPVSYEPR